MSTSVKPRVTPMTALQSRWHDTLATDLRLSRDSFQLSLPATPVPPADDALWALQDVIPPPSSTFARGACAGDRTLDEYAAAAQQMTFAQEAFARDIGQQNYVAWTQYLTRYKHPPKPEALPGIFQRWSIVNAPAVTSIGVADLTEMALIDGAQQALAPYLGAGAKPADFTGGYADLVAMLAASSGARVAMGPAGEGGGDVASTWTGGGDGGVQGLWAGACRGSRLSTTFAASAVTVQASIGRVCTWVCTPGRWYESSLLNMAFAGPTSPPWPLLANPTWEQLFGQFGSLRRMLASTVIADDLRATITSDARYRPADRPVILANAASGLWPFYLAASPTVTTEVTFDDAGALRVDVRSQPGSPLILGQNVLGIGRYLGHATG
jgi:hypothetical protein